MPPEQRPPLTKRSVYSVVGLVLVISMVAWLMRQL